MSAQWRFWFLVLWGGLWSLSALAYAIGDWQFWVATDGNVGRILLLTAYHISGSFAAMKVLFPNWGLE